MDLAIKSINSNDEKWSCRNKTNGFDGKKHYYICKKVRGIKCSADLFILEHPDKTAGVFRCVNMKHNHSIQPLVKVGIDPKTKNEIDRLYNSGVQKPSLILRSLIEQNLVQITKNQLRIYLVQFKKKNFGPFSISLGEINSIVKLDQPFQMTQIWHLFLNLK